jgi:hypothetical protein
MAKGKKPTGTRTGEEYTLTREELDALIQRAVASVTGARTIPTLPPGRSPNAWQQPLTLEQQWIQSQSGKTAPPTPVRPPAQYGGYYDPTMYVSIPQYGSLGRKYPGGWGAPPVSQPPQQQGLYSNSGWYQGPTPDMNWYNNLGRTYGLTWDDKTGGWVMPEKVIGADGKEAWINTMNRWGQPHGTPGPYLQSGGPSSPGSVTGSHMPAGYIGPNPNRGAFNKARAARRGKYKERNPGAEGFGISSAAAGGLAQWS